MEGLSVSAVMPTRGRREFAVHALLSFLAQDYPNRELIILDDEEDPSFPALVNHPMVRYQRVEGHLPIPQKRNMVNALSKRDVIVHWDSDDWSAPGRISEQIRQLETSGKATVGFFSMLAYDGERSYLYTAASRKYALGTSFCYRRHWWLKHPFSNKHKLGSDNRFISVPAGENQLDTVPARRLMVFRIHPANSNPKKITVNYRPVGIEALPAGFPR